MSDVIFEMPETHCYYGLEVSSPSRAVGVDVELSEDGERAAIRSLTVERTAELRDDKIGCVQPGDAAEVAGDELFPQWVRGERCGSGGG